MPTRFELVKVKADWAKKKIDQLDETVLAFGATQPYIVGVQPDAKTGKTLYYLHSVGDVSTDVGFALTDALHALRTTLDHLAFQLFLRNRADPADEGKRIYFPIYDPAKKSCAEAIRPIATLGEQAIKAICDLKPYKGGDGTHSRTLWNLHELDNIGKHRRILTNIIHHGAIDIGGSINEIIGRSLGIPEILRTPRSMPVMSPRTGRVAKVGDILFVGESSDNEVNQKLKFTCDIAISESGIVEGESISETILASLEAVEQLVRDFAPLLD